MGRASLAPNDRFEAKRMTASVRVLPIATTRESGSLYRLHEAVIDPLSTARLQSEREALEHQAHRFDQAAGIHTNPCLRSFGATQCAKAGNKACRRITLRCLTN